MEISWTRRANLAERSLTLLLDDDQEKDAAPAADGPPTAGRELRHSAVQRRQHGGREEMLTQLLLGWTALLSGVQPAAPSVTTKLLSDRGGSRSLTRKCQAFIPPPLPPPLFPTIKQRAELMVDLTEHITGPKGEKGCRGPRGRKGKPGVTGPEGEPGSQGVLGQTGQMGDKGERGWRGLYGDIGTPGMMKGEKGRRGFRGEQGLKGRRGLSGEMRERGLAGRPGEKGDPGQWGDPGQRGEQGPRGPTGVRGSLGLKGAQGPTGKQGHPGPAGLHGLTGDPGLPGQVFILPGLQGDEGDGGPSAKCNCSKVQTPKPQKGRVNTIFIANGERQMRRLRGENVMVLRTDRNSLYIYSDSQWINVLEDFGP